ncbi:MAG: hypothetical protein KUG74_15730 [Rhodobacteraceae bacterium]|nr:hypothetical protein [Paracoccaceae bacterium]
MIITKYFNSDDWDRYEAGGFKIGTLQEYRTSEQDVARMCDTGEGIAQRTFGEGDEYIEHMELPSSILNNVSIRDSSTTAVAVNTRFNEYVFCASEGGYDRSHHVKMIEGEVLDGGFEYAGNKDLDCYAELDLRNFLGGLRFWGRLNKRKITTSLQPEKYVYGRPVSYESRAIDNELKPVSYVDGTVTNDMYQKAVFNKPRSFSTEKEFRIVFRAFAPSFPPIGTLPLYPCIRRLKNSIVNMGKIHD